VNFNAGSDGTAERSRRYAAVGGWAFRMVKADHLRLAAKLSLARAVRTEEPEVVERLVVRAGEYLDQAAALEAAQTRRSTSDIGAAAAALPGGPNIQRGQRTRASRHFRLYLAWRLRRGALSFIGADYVFGCDQSRAFGDVWIAGSLGKMSERSRLSTMIARTY
jgi:hypothetical protein